MGVIVESLKMVDSPCILTGTKEGENIKQKHRESWGIPWHNYVYPIFILAWKYLTITVLGHAGCFL